VNHVIDATFYVDTEVIPGVSTVTMAEAIAMKNVF
jgi:hypothetical protein